LNNRNGENKGMKKTRREWKYESFEKKRKRMVLLQKLGETLIYLGKEN
jgi:hypothetical protein